MGPIERLPLEVAQEDTMLACEHRHRYAFAAALLEGARVLDLCCGSGYGSAMLAPTARTVTGVDVDVTTVETAAATVGRRFENVGFEAADAVGYLCAAGPDAFDAVVCFEGLEHLDDLDGALARLRELADVGVKLLVSLPNDKLSGVENPYHVTQFGYDEAVRAFADFPERVMVPQFLAEGSLILPAEASSTDVEVDLTLGDRYEPQYANHFVFCVGFSPEAVHRVHHGAIHLNVAPIFNRWAEDLKRGAWALRRENARLGRERLGQGGSAAATALQRVQASDERVAGLEHLLAQSEARVIELEAALRAATAPPSDAERDDLPLVRREDAVPATPLEPAPGEDVNSWDQRRRRAAEYLVPWIEQTVPLAGKTVLEYGCGNAAVSCAVAVRAERHIGLDIDADALELGRRELRERGIANVELHHHPVSEVLDAFAAYRGEVDVVLLYAVLEHLTVEERLAVLQTAREVVRPDGAIVVCETPNRLIYFDHHTAQMPFFGLLPDELALRYRQHMPRANIREALDAAERDGGASAAHEALTRLGRGVSFHEFELVFGDLTRHVVASNYDVLLFGERPIHPDEVILSRYLERWRPDLAPVWSRYWLDVILSPQPIERRPPFVRPWVADTEASLRVGWTAWENLHLVGSSSTLWVDLPRPTRRLLVGTVTQDGHWFVLRARPEGAAQAITSGHTAAPRITAFSTFSFDAPVSRIALQASDECHIVFVGYED